MVGTDDYEEYDASGQLYRAAEIVTHPDFVHAVFANDVALVRLDRDLTFDDKVKVKRSRISIQ